MELECPSQDRCAGLQARLPTPDEADGAAHAAQAIAAAMAPGGRVEISGDGGPSISIPPALAQLILEMLGHVASGRMVLLNPVEPLLAMHQAADILNVPRPYLDRLLASGEIPHVEIGRHRRVPLPALLAYRARRRGEREQALDDLARMGGDFERE